MADCDWWDLGCHAAAGVAAAADNVFTGFAKEVLQSVSSAMAGVATWWAKVPSATGDGWGEALGTIKGFTWYIVLALATFSVIVGGIKIAWTMRGEPARELLHSLLILVVVTGAAVPGTMILIDICDGLASWIIDESMVDDEGDFFLSILLPLTIIGGPNLGPVAIVVLGLIAFVVSCLQVILMFFRSVLLILIAAAIPIGAAFYITEMGRNWVKNALGWFLAFAAYKPAAALVYATSITLVTRIADPQAEEPIISWLMGITAMICALVAMPALIKLTVPLVAAMGSGGGGAMAAVAGGAAVATGAKRLFESGSGSGGGGSSGGSSKGTSPLPTPSGSSSTAGSAAGGGTAAGGGAAAAAGGPAGLAVGAAGAAKDKAKEGVEKVVGAIQSETESAASGVSGGSPSGARTQSSGSQAPGGGVPGGASTPQSSQGSTSQSAPPSGGPSGSEGARE